MKSAKQPHHQLLFTSDLQTESPPFSNLHFQSFRAKFQRFKPYAQFDQQNQSNQPHKTFLRGNSLIQSYNSPNSEKFCMKSTLVNQSENQCNTLISNPQIKKAFQKDSNCCENLDFEEQTQKNGLLITEFIQNLGLINQSSQNRFYSSKIAINDPKSIYEQKLTQSNVSIKPGLKRSLSNSLINFEKKRSASFSKVNFNYFNPSKSSSRSISKLSLKEQSVRNPIQRIKAQKNQAKNKIKAKGQSEESECFYVDQYFPEFKVKKKKTKRQILLNKPSEQKIKEDLLQVLKATSRTGRSKSIIEDLESLNESLSIHSKSKNAIQLESITAKIKCQQMPHQMREITKNKPFRMAFNKVQNYKICRGKINQIQKTEKQFKKAQNSKIQSPQISKGEIKIKDSEKKRGIEGKENDNSAKRESDQLNKTAEEQQIEKEIKRELNLNFSYDKEPRIKKIL